MPSLLDLPRELRDIIYRFMITDYALKTQDNVLLADLNIERREDRIRRRPHYADERGPSDPLVHMFRPVHPPETRSVSLRSLARVSRQIREEVFFSLRSANDWHLDVLNILDASQPYLVLDVLTLPSWMSLTSLMHTVDVLTITLTHRSVEYELSYDFPLFYPREEKEGHTNYVFFNEDLLLTLLSRIARAGPFAIKKEGDSNPVRFRKVELIIDPIHFARDHVSAWESVHQPPSWPEEPHERRKSELSSHMFRRFVADDLSGLLLGLLSGFVQTTATVPQGDAESHSHLCYFYDIKHGPKPEAMARLFSIANDIRRSADEFLVQFANRHKDCPLLHLKADKSSPDREWHSVGPQLIPRVKPDRPTRCDTTEALCELLSSEGNFKPWVPDICNYCPLG